MLLTLTRNDDAVSKGFLQSRFWASFKATAGWSYARYEVTATEPSTLEPFALSILERRLGGGLRFAYVPHGPEAALEPALQGELLAALAERLRGHVSAACAFVRFDPAWYAEEASSRAAASEEGDAEGLEPGARQEPGDVAAALIAEPERPRFQRPLVKASDVQPPDSAVLAVDRDDEALLAGMKPKWRYNIRLAEKRGVRVGSEGPGALDDFYALYRTTAARDRIAIHPRSYYERLFALGPANAYEPAPDIRLWIARHEGRPLAAIITVYYGGEATYLYGASSDEGRNLMPAYALQWAAMKAARDAGCSSYDFYGIPPVDDPNHAMAGLYRFKTGFGGAIRHYAGAWDYVLKPATYAAFRAAERARLFWHKSVKKKAGPRRPVAS